MKILCVIDPFDAGCWKGRIRDWTLKSIGKLRQ